MRLTDTQETINQPSKMSARLDEAEIASTRITPVHDTAFVFGKVVLVSELLDHCMYAAAVHCFKNLLEFQRPRR